jgi:hypothetical protein
MMHKYFDLSDLKSKLPDYDHQGDPPAEDDYAPAMLKDLDGVRWNSEYSDADHLVSCFNDAIAGITAGLALRAPPGQLEEVIEALIDHAAATMRRGAKARDSTTPRRPHTSFS